MKKFVMVALALVAGATFNSMRAQQLVTTADSLSYTLGMSNTQGLKDYLKGRLGMDMNYMDQFISGLRTAVGTSSDPAKNAYYCGVQIGQQIATQMLKGISKEIYGNDSTQSISSDLFMAGFVSALTGKDALMTMDDAQKNVKRLMDVVKEESLLKQFGDNKKAGEDFMAAQAKLAKKKKSGITVLPSGLIYKVLVKGDGPVAKATDKVKVKYEGRLIDGTVFDSTEKHGGEPATFSPGQVIKGWTEALTMMPVGSKWQLYIPQELAYGSREAGGLIKPFSALVFDVEVVGIEEPNKEKANSEKKK